ncbi:MAG TPA: peptidoglycan-binding protein [Blastocatellia bacterium]|nr:peptidoglycan-binding protein [Blastocatellia bacterium]
MLTMAYFYVKEESARGNNRPTAPTKGPGRLAGHAAAWGGALSEASSNNFVRWVQSSLNRVLGSGLVVDGVVGTKTLTAIRAFQQQQGLFVDGVVGTKTEAALRAALMRTEVTSVCPSLERTLQRTILGWGRYLRRVEELPPDQQAIVAEVGNTIIASHQPGCKPVRSVQINGHADHDTPRNLEREKQMSEERANQVLVRLQAHVGASIAARIEWQARGFGATQLKAPPTTEANRRQNRRVEVFLSTTVVSEQVEDILKHIREEARKAAERPKTVAGSNFSRVLRSRYLAEYLAAPNPATAALAIARISQQNTSGFVTNLCTTAGCSPQHPQCLTVDCDNWECSTPLFNSPLSPLLRTVPQFQWIPANFGGAATEILRVANRRTLDHIDVDFLIGGRRTLNWLDCATRRRLGAGQDTDLVGDDFKNESQLMHWATGVKFAHLGRDRIRELFLAYELWHLEQWDIFGPDPLNDMIAEDAGRNMADEIRALRLTDANFIQVLDRGFAEARAWVGALLRLRRVELDNQIRAEAPPPWVYHWVEPHPPTGADHPYRLPSIRQMLASGMSVDQVKASGLVARYIDVYTLLFEADARERRAGPVAVSLLQRNMALGMLNNVFRALAAAESGQLSSLRSRSDVRYALLPGAPVRTRLIARRAAG